MPFGRIPLNVAGFPASAAGAVQQGTWLGVSIANPPRPVERFDLGSFYIPVAITAPYSATPPADTAHMTVVVNLSGDTIYQQNVDLGLVQFGATNWARANDVSAGQLQTPVSWRSGQNLSFSFLVRFDNATAGVGYAVLGGAFTDPTVPSAQQVLGSIGYSTAADDLLTVP